MAGAQGSLKQLADKLGYRLVAGPSGTSDTMLQWATYMGHTCAGPDGVTRGLLAVLFTAVLFTVGSAWSPGGFGAWRILRRPALLFPADSWSLHCCTPSLPHASCRYTPDMMVALRMALSAWMIPTDDHSFYEVSEI